VQTEAPTDAWPKPDRNTLVAPPPPGPPAPPPPDRRLGLGMLLALGVLLLVVLGAFVAWLLTHRHHDAGTRTVVVTQATAPPSASATTTRRVRPSGIPIPDVRGLPLTRAQSMLQGAGFRVRPVTVPSRRPRGTVVAESPRAGASGSRDAIVRLNVARGVPAQPTMTTAPRPSTTTAATATTATTTTTPAHPQTATVPDLSGTQLQAAVTKLNGAGLLASIQYIPGADPLETVEQQAPSAGGTARWHSHVTVNASSGPGDKARETVPSVLGGSLQQAVAAANGAHLRLIYVKLTVTSRAQAGKVIEQTPLAGRQAPQNAQILVYVGAYRSGP
jgi:beta-lactam-binding protein with PASTA domain